jgi:hypothetical protein
MTGIGKGTGTCLCGQVRYSFPGQPLLTAICHCRHCQKQGGSAFSTVCAVPATGFEQTGVTRIFADKGDSGEAVARHFCPECGSPILSIAAALPDLILIKAGTMDGFADLVPTLEAYCDSRLSWLSALAGAAQFAGSNIGVDDSSMMSESE